MDEYRVVLNPPSLEMSILMVDFDLGIRDKTIIKSAYIYKIDLQDINHNHNHHNHHHDHHHHIMNHIEPVVPVIRLNDDMLREIVSGQKGLACFSIQTLAES